MEVLSPAFRRQKHNRIKPPQGGTQNVRSGGFTLLELIITITVLAVLALGTIPVMQNAVRRQKEQKLRETLREIRLAIDEFHRDAVGNPQCQPVAGAAPQPIPDPRSRVMIADCKIFEASKDNPDRYPPSLELLYEGVEVTPRSQGIRGGRGTQGGNATDILKLDDDGATEPKKKYYLRELPVDPITGESDWILRSSYQEADSPNWDENNVFDVRSSAEGETLDGVKYSDL